MMPSGTAAVPGGRRRFAVFGAAAVLAVALLCVLGAPATHSAGFNMAWSVQFSELLRGGILYPRWLPDAFGGLGSPTFIFYAPSPFYLATIIDLLSFGVSDPRRLVGLLCAALLVASGLAMASWLRRRFTAREAALGGLLYVVAPYHLYDAFVRGSLGELTAFVLLPLLAGAMEDVLDGRRRGAPLFAGYAGLLVLSHLPSALMIGGIFVPARLAFLLCTRPREPRPVLWVLLRLVVAGLVGLGLAAIYLVPALGLLDMARMDYFDGGQYDARRWLLLAPGAWSSAVTYAFMLSLNAAGLWLGIAALVLAKGAGRPRDAIFWPLLLLGLVLLMSGLVPGVWEPVSPLAKIEFPWRLLLLAEFAAVMVIVEGISRWRDARAPLVLGAAAIIAVPAMIVLYGTAAVNYRVMLWNPEWQAIEARAMRLKPDAIEYLPQGHPVGFGGNLGISWDAVFALSEVARDRGAAWLEPAAGHVFVTPLGPRGALSLRIEAAEPARVVLRRYYYPLWRLETGTGEAAPALGPHGPDRLLSFMVPAGTTTLRLVWSPPALLAIGAGISGVSAALLAVLVILALRRRRLVPATGAAD